MQSRFAKCLLLVVAFPAGACQDSGTPDDGGDPPAEPFVTVFIDTTVGSIAHTAAVAEAGGRMHIVYSTDGVSNLRYAVCDGGCDTAVSWRRTTVDTVSNVGAFNSVAMGPGGSLHATYVAYDDSSNVRYAECPGACDDSSHWQTVTIDTTLLSGRGTGLAVANGVRYAFYLRVRSGASDIWRMRLATCAADCGQRASWTITAFDSSAYLTLSPQAVRTDAAGVLHLVYSRMPAAGPLELMYTRCAANCATTASWTPVRIDSTTAWGFSGTSPGPRLEVAASGPRVLFWGRSATPIVKIAACDTGCGAPESWRFNTVTAVQPSENEFAFALDPSGGMHVLLQLGPLQYAKCSASCGPEPWPTMPVHSNPTTKAYSIVAPSPRAGMIFLSAGHPGGSLVFARER